MSVLRSRWLQPVWLVARVWLGIQWLEAGWHKVLDPKWMVTGEAVQGYWMRVAGLLPDAKPMIKYGWYHSFITWMTENGHHVFMGKLVAVGEVLVGVGLILGIFTVAAAFFGALMNLNYMLCGTTSSNPVLYTLSILIMIAGPAAYYWGGDRFVLPYVSRLLSRIRKTRRTRTASAQA
ncbi:MAG: DoxX family membrane protein [Bacillota bacterium]|nr:MAG: DoxX family membrane protein [Bacillota bacterium]